MLEASFACSLQVSHKDIIIGIASMVSDLESGVRSQLQGLRGLAVSTGAPERRHSRSFGCGRSVAG